VAVSPDFAGFADAQTRLRDHFGDEVTFKFEPQPTYPPNTPLDPETGLPYDPVVAATDITQATTTVKCNIVFKAINRAGISGDVEASALGFIEAGDIMLIADIAERDQIDGAIEFVVRDEVWLIVATRVDAIGTVQRYLVFGRKK
jgi:hypothetical protein